VTGPILELGTGMEVNSVISGGSAITSDALGPKGQVRPNIQGFLDRHRPHDLLPPTGPAARLPACRRLSLCYRYLDILEVVQVPNVWYNQTREMRFEYWTEEIATVQERIALTLRQKTRTTDLKDVQALEARAARWIEKKALLTRILDDARQGVQFV